MNSPTPTDDPIDLNSLTEFDDSEFSSPQESLIDTEFITGAAGTGKSFLCRQRVESSPEGSVVLSASTGIAAVNMGEGVTTIHSLIGFFDYQSLQDSFINGRIQRKLKRLYEEEGVREIILDEISMISGPTLDLLYTAFNEAAAGGCPIKLTVTGDFMQLPPVPEKDSKTGRNLPLKWAFDASAWPSFAAHTTKLEKIWRQTDPTFLESLQALRRGDGSTGLAGLQKLGVRFSRETDEEFLGTTLRAKNDEVDRYNQARLLKLEGKAYAAKSYRWGVPKVFDPGANRQPGDWKMIPEAFQFKVGALCMILANDLPSFSFVNGDLGVIEGMAENRFQIRLRRNDKIVQIGRIIRRVETKHLPDEFDEKECLKLGRDEAMEKRLPYLRPVAKGTPRWVLGEIEYFPLRLAWATTVHKSQSLSLPEVQIDMRSHFIASPGMMYVAVSRCRTPEGLRLIGEPELLVEKCNTHERVKEYL